MIFQIDPVREVSLALYVVLIVIEFWIGSFFLNAYRKNRELNIIGSIGMFFVFMAAGRILLIIFDFYLTEMQYILYETHFGFYKVAAGVQEIGLGFFFYVADKSLFQGKDKYLFLIGFVVFDTIAKIIPNFNLSQNIVMIAGLFIIFIPISYLITAFRAKGPIRIQSLLIFLGFLSFALGSLIAGENLMNLLEPIFGSRYAVHILTVLCKLVGVAIVYQGFRRQLRE